VTPPPAPSVGTTRPASTYVVVAVVGVALLLLGLWTPFLAPVPWAVYLRPVLAAAGGVLAVFGWARYSQRRRPRARGPPERSDRVQDLPSFEIYSPGDEGRGSGRRGPRTRALWGAPRSSVAPLGRVRGSRGRALPWVAVALVAVFLLSPGLALVSSDPSTGATHARPTPSIAPTALPVPAGAASTAAPTAGPVPVCSLVYPPPYQTFGGFYPPLPLYAMQAPCKTAHDESHLTFSSSVAQSGERLRVPVHLPVSGNPGQTATYGDFYLGMVVTGDPNSVDQQSYAELAFIPNGNATAGFHWSVGVAVWSLLVGTSCSIAGPPAQPSGLNLSFQNAYACVQDQVGGTHGVVLNSSVPGGQWANVTMVGGASGSQPLSIYFNDTTVSAYSAQYTFSSAHTGTYSFHPAYTTACPTRCVLNWSTPFGLGVGVDLCEASSCFSYNASVQAGAPPFEIGSPESWTGLGYSGDYLYFGPSSSTGACSGAGPVVPCDPYAQAGDYPFFTFNGTTFNFGANWTGTTEAFGGPYVEFNALGTMNQYLPLFLDRLANASQAGYVAPGTALNVSVRAQDFGRISTVNLSYQQPGASWANETIALASGAPSFGTYNGSIPASGLNGTVSYRLWATNAAGGSVALPAPGSPPATVEREAIPTVTVGIGTTPSGCGGVSVGGGPYLANGTNAFVPAGFYTVSSSGCYPYHFDHWATTGGLTVSGTGATASLTAHANGTITAVLRYYHPLDTIHLLVGGCGEVFLNSTAFVNGSTAYLVDAGAYALSPSACSGESFGGWTVSNSANLSILGSVLTLHGNGTLTGLYVPTSGTSPVGFQTYPSACGGVFLRGTGYVTGESVHLANGNYPVGPDPCAGWGFNGSVATSGSVAVTGLTLAVSGGGLVDFSYYKLTLVTLLTRPSGCGQIVWDSVPMGNGAVLNITNHTQHAIAGSPCNGTYFSGWSATGGVTILGTTAVLVDGPGSLEANFLPGTPHEVVEFRTDPSTCGSVVFDGTTYLDSQYVIVPPTTVASVSSLACSGYGFVTWSWSGGITVVGGLAYVNGTGSITAVFHPLALVAIYTTPSNCGSVEIGSTGLVNNATEELPDGTTYPIVAVPCAYHALSAWITSTGATIANGTLTLSGAATITAQFGLAIYRVHLAVAVGGCANVVVGTTPYANNSTVGLTAGPYPLSAAPCPGYALVSWQTTNNLTVSGGSSATLTVRGGGTVTAIAPAVPPSVTIALPTSAAAGSTVFLTAVVPVPVPPYNYSYTWSFGDGAKTTVPANTTSHAYSSPGNYLVTVSLRDPLGRAASAEANLTIVAAANGPTFGIGTTGLVVLGVAGAVVALAAAVFVVRARRERNRPPDRETEPTYGSGTNDETGFPPA